MYLFFMSIFNKVKLMNLHNCYFDKEKNQLILFFDQGNFFSWIPKNEGIQLEKMKSEDIIEVTL